MTGVILAGGRGSRMGGVDKGLQLFNGTPLVQNALQRLMPQVGRISISANRNLPAYAAFGAPVLPDDNTLGEFAGPLAGIAAGLIHCTTPYLLTVPCDAPYFPLDLAERLAMALANSHADFAIASAPESNLPGAPCQPQPVFSLMKLDVLKSLKAYSQSGGRKVSSWMLQHPAVFVPFNQPGDGHNAFFNANTLEELKRAQYLV